MVQIANPIYDVVFKYLMRDEKVAKLLLSAIIGKEVLSLEFRPTEHTLAVSETLTVLRMDFSARIADQEGRQELVIIELQKAKMAGDIMRFRRYLGSQYANKENVFRESTEEAYGTQKALPILSIYLLGEPLPKIKAPVVRVNRIYTDAATGEQIHDKEEFIESLTHDSIVIQIAYLKGHRRNELEQLLALFDQSLATNDPHLMLIDDMELPERYRPLLRKLQQAIANPTIRESMDAEDELLEELKYLERQIFQRDSIIEKKDEILQEKDAIIEKKDDILQEKDAIIEKKDEVLQEMNEALKEKDQAIAHQHQQLASAISKLHAKGMGIGDLSAMFDLEESAVQALLGNIGKN
ncbi:MAG: hypothetical protein RI973_844 [Bacteroidota bacterium]|jgi:hypothetical protein